jgi:hypothetical protein
MYPRGIPLNLETLMAREPREPGMIIDAEDIVEACAEIYFKVIRGGGSTMKGKKYF